ncbi:MAG: DNA-processing protein DprA [Bacteroidia bacterium]|nr:DNA-processing protein DprA [Bacteroidia bacterium]
METTNEERICVCALNRLLGFEPKTAHELIARTGSAWNVFNMTEQEKLELLGPFSKLSSLIKDSEIAASENELERLGSEGCRFITMSDEGYPELLKECDDAPLGLYFKSISKPEDVFNRIPQIAVVGTRDISLYGKEWCRRIVGSMAMAKNKPLIVSGFAYGTDIIAHLAALEAGLPTVAVMPVGIDEIYPSRHRKYASTLQNTPGCAIVTDYPPGTEPKPINFIRRNRIIAGICSGTVLIESRSKGGGMITARLASSYDRDLFVLPGRADDQRSAGCNALLREKLADPITDCAHFLDAAGLGNVTRRKKQHIVDEALALFKQLLTENEMEELLSVLECIRAERGISLEDICPRVRLAYGTVSRYAGMLESEGVIEIDLLQRCCINLKNV